MTEFQIHLLYTAYALSMKLKASLRFSKYTLNIATTDTSRYRPIYWKQRVYLGLWYNSTT